MTTHAAIKNTFLEDFSVQKCLTIIPVGSVVVSVMTLVEEFHEIALDTMPESKVSDLITLLLRFSTAFQSNPVVFLLSRHSKASARCSLCN